MNNEGNELMSARVIVIGIPYNYILVKYPRNPTFDI